MHPRRPHPSSRRSAAAPLRLRRPAPGPHHPPAPPATRSTLTFRFDDAFTRIVHDTAEADRPVSISMRADHPPISAADARWVLASRTQQLLQGTVLRPSDRDELLRAGKMMGLTPFQTSLIVAIVQDQARRGEPLGSAADLIAMVSPPAQEFRARFRGDHWRVAGWCVLAVIAEVLALILLVN